DVGRAHGRRRSLRPPGRAGDDRHRNGALRGRDHMLQPDPVPAGHHRRPDNPDRRGSRRAGPARRAVPGWRPQPALIAAATTLTATAAGFVLLLWAVGRVVTARAVVHPPRADFSPILAMITSGSSRYASPRSVLSAGRMSSMGDGARPATASRRGAAGYQERAGGLCGG